MAEENSSSGATARSRRISKYLPEELQEKILLRLPIKSLIRFESVCKTWLFTFHSRRFIDLYGQRGCRSNYSLELHTISAADLRKMVPGLIDQCNIKTSKRSNTKECWGYVVFVLGPLNGIYCLTSHLHEKYGDRYSILTGKIALCNPATHDYKFTNPFPCKFHSLLSNISSKHPRLHFGFGNVKDQKNNSLDYRVVVLIHYGGTQNPQNSSFLIFVYSVQRGEWKKIVDYEPGKKNVGKRKATEAFNIQGRRILHINNTFEGCPQRFFEGCYYWMAGIEGEDSAWNVLSFNFADQSFKLIGAPPRYRDYFAAIDEQVYVWGEVFVLHDRLAVIYLFNVLLDNGVSRTVEVGVWMMMEYGVEESWTRIYTIKPNFDGDIYMLYGIHYQPLKSGGIRIERLVFKDRLKKQIISCDDAGYEVNNVCDPEFKVCWNTPGISAYIETLERL